MAIVEKKLRTTMWRDQESYQEGNSNILEDIKDSPVVSRRG